MLQLQVPALLKINGNITINLSNAVSQAVEKDLPQKRIKETAQADIDSTNRRVSEEDYEVYGEMDTVSFWFVGGTSLSYRVSEEISQEDFDRITETLKELTYKGKNERKPSDKPDIKKT